MNEMNEPSGNSGQLAPDAGSGGDAPIDVTDPWRGLYRSEHLRANGDGDLYHPDLPSWPDDREEGLDKLVRAQGFDFQVIDGEFSDEATEDGGDLYWQEMRAWNPEAPEGEWRLAWKGDTEDGPCAWFVRPMALRPEPDAIAARQPVGVEPVYWQSRFIGSAWSYCTREHYEMVRACPEEWPGYEVRSLYAAPSAPAAVPVDGPLSGKYGTVLRPFVAMMERELHANAGKGDRPGWLSMDSSTALLEIYHHMGKLQRATKNADEPGIVEYAADVANMAMMLVDVCGLLPVEGDIQPQPAAAKDGE